MDFRDYPLEVVQDIVRLRRRIEQSGIPPKRLDYNLLIGTWNIRGLGSLYEKWEENPGSPKRNLRGLAYIAEIIRRFDVIAIQEVKGDTSAIRTLLAQFLGSDWSLLLSDVTAGSGGNNERLGFIYDTRRVRPSGLAGEIVLARTAAGDPMDQLARTPYLVGFESAREKFTLLTAHILYGKTPTDRLPELKNLAGHIADELRNRARATGEESNLVVLGDFNIDDRGTNPLFQEFVSCGLKVPDQLLNLRTTYDTKPKYYDQIAWFMGELALRPTGKAGVIDFAGALLKNLEPLQMTYRVSDHFPLWVEFLTDRSEEAMCATLGVLDGTPHPFAGVPD